MYILESENLDQSFLAEVFFDLILIVLTPVSICILKSKNNRETSDSFGDSDIKN